MKTVKLLSCLTGLFLGILLLCIHHPLQAQVKIGNNPTSINANSLFELETTNQGMLPARVALNSISSEAPLTAPVPQGMTVFSIGGTLTDGYYFWSGTMWIPLITGYDGYNIVTKTANCTLLKRETLVLASGDITVTLPAITSADNGLAITVKNIGTYLDLITVKGNTAAVLIDSLTEYQLPRYKSRSFIAYEGKWFLRERNIQSFNNYEVEPSGSWKSLDEMLGFLAEHISGPTTITLTGSSLSITNTQVINLAYPLTIQSTSYGNTVLSAGAGLSGMPMFQCHTECYFKQLVFDGTSLAGYGTLAGEDAIQLLSDATYHEVKDCTFEGFYNAIMQASGNELWLFECDIAGARNGVLIQSNDVGTKLRISETDFMDCRRGVNMNKGTNMIVQLNMGSYDNTNATDTSIRYNPAGCTFAKMQINYNAWNNIGVFLSGFDFTRTDGRDAHAYVESNAGIEDKSPHCKINVRNNGTGTSISNAGTWFKCAWVNTSFNTCKFKVENNRITYLPDNSRDVVVTITGNLTCNNSSRVVSIGLVKNGITGTRYGECDLRITTSNQPFQFATVIYLDDVSHDDYFELFCTSTSGSDVLTFQDIQWYTEAR